ncbi:RNA pyrophosphohydrolase [Sinimarinibacterium sp. CAU 1509]|uniref:RNA pyrophosphohydrolase n=1 Tax=Sinimarinibacterium sp. CAU 1509 TaxID=2562283 RepID=UPI0010AD176C|nr:RNA pyrophosphohydrolase [Sinimarinibacterium sp. CAU 1509]TJY64853.1 RNA pyrophosphohydrolase [Sinimarinibacterium sp. CAU 1509]
MIDADGFRPNVGIIVSGADGRLLWAKRINQDAWQFPQGGIKRGESPRDALYRELHEELGLHAPQVEIIGVTSGWLRYRLPSRYLRRTRGRLCIGQKQKWFALRLLSSEDAVCLDGSDKPEFDGWRWVDYWHPLTEVVEFKREVYRRALIELAPMLGVQADAPAAIRRTMG